MLAPQYTQVLVLYILFRIQNGAVLDDLDKREPRRKQIQGISEYIPSVSVEK